MPIGSPEQQLKTLKARSVPSLHSNGNACRPCRRRTPTACLVVAPACGVPADIPMDAGEVDAPLVPGRGRAAARRHVGQQTPGQRQLHAPATIAARRAAAIVEAAVHPHRAAHGGPAWQPTVGVRHQGREGTGRATRGVRAQAKPTGEARRGLRAAPTGSPGNVAHSPWLHCDQPARQPTHQPRRPTTGRLMGPAGRLMGR